MTDNTVLRVKADVPVECAFRKPDSFNALQTYPVPPLTTIRGMIYAALGRPSLLNQSRKPYTPSKDVIDREREFRQMVEEKTQIGLSSPDRGIKQTDLRNRMKVARSNEHKQYKTYVAQEETIISPSYDLFIRSDDHNLLREIKRALENPQRLLYMGRSDDIVCLMDISTHEYRDDDLPQNTEVLAPSPDGRNPFLLPVKSDYKGRYSTRPAESQMVSLCDSVEAKKITVEGAEKYFTFID